MTHKSYKRLRLVLGDQLNAKHSWFATHADDTLYVLAELPQELSYARHHVQKICAFFAAMANFAEALKKKQHHALLLTLDDTKDYASLPDLLNALADQYNTSFIEYQRPDEYRLFQQLRQFQKQSTCTVVEYDSEHFLLPFTEIATHFEQGKAQTMEFFYRKMRKRFKVLMQDHQPLGGQWNYDSANRASLTAADLAKIPTPQTFRNNVSDIVARLKRHQAGTFGTARATLAWPTNRQQALAVLDSFCKQALKYFGRFQDAMVDDHPYNWSLFHSRLSFALNTKMLHPKQVINRAIAEFNARNDIDIAQIEGFVRQLLGWREFMRGIYWANMPTYARLNHLVGRRELPAYFWTGETKMRCVAKAVNQSLDHAFAHHIQRLMITGNFCLLTGMNPTAVDAWYLGIYVDAIEWVEMPNARGMSQYADGGIVASKPYAAGGNYINKMSDYCGHCYYRVKQKTGKRACPFNSLYWHFLDRHRQQFERHPRMAMLYQQWQKRDEHERSAIINYANQCLEQIESL